MGLRVQSKNKENNNLANNLQSSSETSIPTLDDVSLSATTSDTSSSGTVQVPFLIEKCNVIVRFFFIGIYSDLSTTSSTISLSEILSEENVDTCTCGRLQNNFNSSIPPCKFCTAQIIFLDNLTKQKNDFLIAKELEKKLNSRNVEDYNLRKRPCSTLSSGCKKIKKLSKGQRTLQQLLQENSDKK